MKKNRFPVSAIVAGIIAFVINLVVIGNAVSGVNMDWSGFALDRQGLLYIGGTGIMEVIREGKKIGMVETPTSRGFQFTIENGDTILLMTGTSCYRLDLKGNVLEKAEVDWELYAKLVREAHFFSAGNGLTYRMSSPWGRTQIAYEQDGKETVVYQMPGSVFILRILFVLSFISLGYCLFAVFRWKRGKEKKTVHQR